MLTSCASKMPLERGKAIAISENSSLAVFTIKTRNEHTKYRLEPRTVTIKKMAVNGKSVDPKSFEFPSSSHEVDGNITTSFANLQLAPGNYTISQIDGFTELAFLAIIPTRGRYDQKVNLKFTINPNEIAYLGSLEAVLQKKSDTGDEESAGPALPIIDQLHTGMTDGTFHFTITDQFERDSVGFKNRYPALNNKSFRKELMHQ